jgi:hypothetical protein
MKGHKGESCAEAISAAMEPGEIVAASELYDRIKRMGSWRDETIWQHLMGLIVNLPAARHHWPSAKPILFLRADGRYELFNPQKHPQPIA